MQGLVEQVNDAIEFLKPRISQMPRIGLILGTGLGDFTKQIEQDTTIPYQEIPHFPRSAACTETRWSRWKVAFTSTKATQ